MLASNNPRTSTSDDWDRTHSAVGPDSRWSLRLPEVTHADGDAVSMTRLRDSPSSAQPVVEAYVQASRWEGMGVATGTILSRPRLVPRSPSIAPEVER